MFDDPTKKKKRSRIRRVDESRVRSLLDQMRGGTSSQESGGRTKIVNPDSGAAGEFQVMPSNVGDWTEKYYKRRLSVAEFRNNPEAQRAVFDGEMGDYVRTALRRADDDVTAKRMAAAAWYGGKGAMHRYDDPNPQYYKGDRSKKYPSFRDYTSKVAGRTASSTDTFADFLKGLDEIVPPADPIDAFTKGLDEAVAPTAPPMAAPPVQAQPEDSAVAEFAKGLDAIVPVSPIDELSAIGEAAKKGERFQRQYTRREIKPGDQYFEFEKTGKAGEMEYLGQAAGQHYAKNPAGDEYVLETAGDKGAWSPVNPYTETLKFDSGEYKKKANNRYIGPDGDEYRADFDGDNYSIENVSEFPSTIPLQSGKTLKRVGAGEYRDEAGSGYKYDPQTKKIAVTNEVPDNPAATDADYQQYLDYARSIGSTPMPRDQFFKQASRPGKAVGVQNIQSDEEIAAATQNQKDVDEYNTAIEAYNKKYGQPAGEAVRIPRNWKTNEIDLTDDQLKDTTIDYQVNLRNATGDKDVFALRAALKQAQREFGLSDSDVEAIATQSGTSPFIEGDINDQSEVVVSLKRGAIGKAIGWDKVKAQYEEERGPVEFALHEQVRDKAAGEDTSGQVPGGSGFGDMSQAEYNVATDPFSAGTQGAVSDEQARLDREALSPEEIAEAQSVGETLGPWSSAIIGSSGRSLSALAGISRITDALPEDWRVALSKEGQKYELASATESKRNTGMLDTAIRLTLGTAADTPRFLLLSRLPGGAPVLFGADAGLQSAGRGETFQEGVKQVGVGVAIGAVFKASSKIAQIAESGALRAFKNPVFDTQKGWVTQLPQSLRDLPPERLRQLATLLGGNAVKNTPVERLAGKLFGEGARLGTIALGTSTIHRMEGNTPAQSLEAGIAMALLDVAMRSAGAVRKEDIAGLAGKIFRGRKGEEKIDVVVEANGDIRRLNGEVPEELVDGEIVVDPVGPDRPPVPVKRGNAIDTSTPPRELQDVNPQRIEAADPVAVTKAGTDKHVTRITEILKGRDFTTVDEIAKATRFSKANIEAAVMTLYGARMVELLPGNRVRLISEAEAKQPTDIFEKAKTYGQTPAVPSQPAPVGEKGVVSPPATQASTSAPVTETSQNAGGTSTAKTTPAAAPEFTPAQQAEAANQAGISTRVSPEQMRRDEGRFMLDGVMYERQPEIDSPKGKASKVKFADNESPDFSYRLIEADQLQPVHTGGTPNLQHFIPEAQPKARTDKASVKAADRIADNLNFAELGESPNAYAGAPIVNARGEVIQGNNRSAGIKLHYGKGGETYKQELAANADRFGFTAEQIAGLKNPVLVRQIDADDATAISLGNYDAQDTESGGSHRIDPTRLSARIPHEGKRTLLADVFIGADDDSTLNQLIRENAPRIAKHLEPYLTDTQRQTMFNDKGVLTRDGAEDIETALTHFLFEGGGNNLPYLFENLPHASKQGIVASLPKIFGTEEEKSIVQDIQNGILAANSFRESGLDTFDDWLRQPDMLKGGIAPQELYTPVEIALAKKFLDAKRQKDIKDVFTKYAKEVSDTEGDMFDAPTKGRAKPDAIKSVFGVEYKERNEPQRPDTSRREDAGAETRANETARVGPDEGTREPAITPPKDVEGKKGEPETRREALDVKSKIVADQVEANAEAFFEEKPVTKFATVIETGEPAKDYKTVPRSVKRSMVRREIAKEGADAEEIAKAFGFSPEEVRNTRVLGEKGKFGQTSHRIRKYLHDPANFPLINKVAKVVLPEARVNANNALFGAQDAVNALLDTMAEESGVERSSQMGREEWKKVLDNYAHRMPFEFVTLIHDALAHQERWHQQRENFLNDKELTAVLEKVGRIVETGGKLAGYKDLPLPLRKDILRIGRKYGTRENTGDSGLSDNVIRETFDKALRRTIGEELASGADREADRKKGAEKPETGETEVLFSKVGGKKQTDTAEFKKWFGDSKVVDEKGEPLVVYHGTRADFDIFDIKKMGTQGTSEGQGFYFTDSPPAASRYGEKGSVMPVFLSLQKPLNPTKKTISKKAYSQILTKIDPKGEDYLTNYGDVGYEGYSPVLREATDAWEDSDNDVDLIGDLVNAGVPLDRIRAASGFDGSITRMTWDDIEHDIYVVFEPTQIKSAIGNRGTFDHEDPNILFSRMPKQDWEAATASWETLAAKKAAEAGRDADPDEAPSVASLLRHQADSYRATAEMLRERQKGVPYKSERSPEYSPSDIEGRNILFTQTDLFGNIFEPEPEQPSMFDMAIAADNADLADAYGQSTADYLTSLEKSPNKLVAKVASELIDAKRMVAAKGDNARKIVEDAADALDAFAVAQHQKAPIKLILDQQRLDSATLSDRARTFAAMMEAGSFAKKFRDELSRAESGTEVLFQAAWHGSPHTFDKFDISKIGTGEGAQAYGYGLYFAGKEDVADFYKHNLSRKNPFRLRLPDGREIVGWPAYDSIDDPVERRAVGNIIGEGSLEEAERKLRLGASVSALSNDAKAIIAKSADKVREWIDGGATVDIPKGAKYKVELKPSEDEYLLWDKPLSEQSEKVKKAVEIHQNRPDAVLSAEYADHKPTGQDFYKDIATTFDQRKGDPAQASEYLKSLGIRGIKYLDGSSRGKGEGSFNYVVFDQSDITILEINGTPVSALGDDATNAESLIDTLGPDIEILRNLRNAETFQPKGFRSLNIPTQNLSLARVFRLAQNLKIRDAIVGSLPVDMVNLLKSAQLTPEMLFHQPTVFRDLLSVDRDNPIPVLVNKSGTTPDDVTGLGAVGRVSPLSAKGRPADRTSADRAVGDEGSVARSAAKLPSAADVVKLRDGIATAAARVLAHTNIIQQPGIFDDADVEITEVHYTKEAKDELAKLRKHVRTVTAGKSEAQMFADARFTQNKENGLVEMNEEATLAMSAAFRGMGVLDGDALGAAMDAPNLAKFKTVWKMTADFAADSGNRRIAKHLNRLLTDIDAFTHPAHGDIAFAYTSPKFPEVTKHTAQEEIGHLADIRTGILDPDPFEGADGYEEAKEHLRGEDYAERMIHREVLGKIGRDDAAKSLGITEEEVDGLRDIRDLQLLEAGITHQQFIEAYAKISDANQRRADNYAKRSTERSTRRLRRSSGKPDTGDDDGLVPGSRREARQGSRAEGAPVATPAQDRSRESRLRQASILSADRKGNESLAVREPTDILFSKLGSDKPEAVEKEQISAFKKAFSYLYDGKRDVKAAEMAMNIMRTGYLAGISVIKTNLHGNTINIATEQLSKPAMALADIANAKLNPKAKGMRYVPGLSIFDIAEGFLGKEGLIRSGLFGGLTEKENRILSDRGGFFDALISGIPLDEAKKIDMQMADAEEGSNFVRNTGVPLIDGIIEGTKRLVIGIDRPFKAFARAAELRGMTRIAAKNFEKQYTDKVGVAKLLDQNWRKRMKDFQKDPSLLMHDIAERYAETVTFQNPNAITDVYDRFRKIMLDEKEIAKLIPTAAQHRLAKHLGQGLYVASGSFAPFVRTPTNIGARTLEYFFPTGVVAAAFKFYRIGQGFERTHWTEEAAQARADELAKIARRRGKENAEFKAETKKYRDGFEKRKKDKVAAFDADIEATKNSRALSDSAKSDRLKKIKSDKAEWLKTWKAKRETYIENRKEEAELIDNRRRVADMKTKEEWANEDMFADVKFTAFENKAFAETAGRVGFGATIGGLLLLAVIYGLIDAVGETEYDDEKGKWYAKRAAGIPDNSVRVGGYRFPYENNPFGNAMKLGVNLFEQYDRPGKSKDRAGAMAMRFGRDVAGLNPFTNQEYKKDDLASWAGSKANAVTPILNMKILQEIGEVMDERPRKYWDEGFAAQYIIKIPELRESLPPSKTFVGQRGNRLRRATRLFDPLKTTRELAPQKSLPKTPLASKK